MLSIFALFNSGVSAMSMCQANCTWMDEVKVDLYPWDAGTDDGVTYVVSSICISN